MESMQSSGTPKMEEHGHMFRNLFGFPKSESMRRYWCITPLYIVTVGASFFGVKLENGVNGVIFFMGYGSIFLLPIILYSRKDDIIKF